MKLAATLMVAVLVSSSIGCGQSNGAPASSAAPEGLSLQEQCKQLTDTIDKGNDALTKQKDTSDPGKDAEKGAGILDQNKAAIGKLAITDPTLKKHADAYLKVMTEMSAVMRELAKLMKADPDKVDQKQMDALDKRTDKMQKDEDDTLKQLETYCEGK